MKLSTKSKYGLKACQVLAENYERQTPIPLNYVSEKAGVTDAYLEQIIILLKKANIVDSVRGVSGGYYLVKAPNETTIGEILRALEDGLEIIGCINNPCSSGEPCKARNVWTKIYDGINQILDSMTLQEMIDEDIK
jgi:Rrf2 family protein